MTRWLALLILLAPCGGCMVFEDLFFDSPFPMQQGTCGAQAPQMQQTPEPPLR